MVVVVSGSCISRVVEMVVWWQTSSSSSSSGSSSGGGGYSSSRGCGISGGCISSVLVRVVLVCTRAEATQNRVFIKCRLILVSKGGGNL